MLLTFIHTAFATLFQSIYQQQAGFIGIFILRWLTIFDIYTNFICATMSYKAFKSYYGQFCSQIDACCKICCRKLLISDQDIMMDVVNNEQSQNTMTEDTKTNTATVSING